MLSCPCALVFGLSRWQWALTCRLDWGMQRGGGTRQIRRQRQRGPPQQMAPADAVVLFLYQKVQQHIRGNLLHVHGGFGTRAPGREGYGSSINLQAQPVEVVWVHKSWLSSTRVTDVRIIPKCQRLQSRNLQSAHQGFHD